MLHSETEIECKRVMGVMMWSRKGVRRSRVFFLDALRAKIMLLMGTARLVCRVQLACRPEENQLEVSGKLNRCHGTKNRIKYERRRPTLSDSVQYHRAVHHDQNTFVTKTLCATVSTARASKILMCSSSCQLKPKTICQSKRDVSNAAGLLLAAKRISDKKT